jgi:hypothetical protein
MLHYRRKVDPMEELTDVELRKSYWLLTHLEGMGVFGKKALIIFDIALCVAVLALATYLLLIDRSSSQIIENFQVFAREKMTLPQLPQAVSVSAVGSVPGNGGRSDVYALVSNQNDHVRVVFTPRFIVDGTFYDGEETYIYPRDSKYVLLFSRELSNASTVQFEAKDPAWYRVSQKEMQDIKNKRAFHVSKDIVAQSEPFLSRISFSLTNASAYNYWELKVPVVVLRGTDVLAVARAYVADFKAGEQRKLEARWFSSLPLDQSVRYVIEPEVDVFDEKVFKRFESPLVSGKR